MDIITTFYLENDDYNDSYLLLEYLFYKNPCFAK